MKYQLSLACITFFSVAFAAQAQQPNTIGFLPGSRPTLADVQRVVDTITADRSKVQAYCEIVSLDDQIADAEQKRNEKRVAELSRKADERAKKLGREFTTMMASFQQIVPSAEEGEQLARVFDALDRLCK